MSLATQKRNRNCEALAIAGERDLKEDIVALNIDLAWS